MAHSSEKAQELELQLEIRVKRLAGIGGWEINLLNGTVRWTKEMYRIYQVPFDYPLQPETLHIFFPQEAQEKVSMALQDCIHEGISFELVLPLQTAKQEKRWVKLQGERLFTNEKNFIYGYLQDITAQTQAEQALRDSEARFRMLFESAPSSLFLVSEDHRIRHANKQSCELFGYEESELLGKTPFDLTHPEDREKSQDFSKKLQEHKDQPLQIEKRYLRKDGEIIHTILRSVYLPSSPTYPPSHISHIIDITNKKELEIEQQRLQKRALETQHLEGLALLAGGIAHDFNNILSGILCHTDLAMLQDSTSATKKHLEHIIQATLKASELCQQLLAYSGKGRFLLQKIQLSETTSDVLHFLETNLSHSVRFQTFLEPMLPLFEADANQLRLLIVNIVTNSIDALQKKEGQITIRTGYQLIQKGYISNHSFVEPPQEGPHVYLEVTDTGCGIQKNLYNKIFTPFYTTKTQGRGLGLSAVLGIMRSYQGGIYLRSEPQEGTTLRLFFPVLDKETPSSERLTPPSISPGTGLLLFVDDDKTIRDVGRQILSNAGYRVICAEDGEKGLHLFQENHRELEAVILDLTMPKMGGLEASQRMRQINQDIPILFSSGYTNKELHAQTEEDPRISFLQKPYRPKDLLQKLQELIIRHAWYGE